MLCSCALSPASSKREKEEEKNSNLGPELAFVCSHHCHHHHHHHHRPIRFNQGHCRNQLAMIGRRPPLDGSGIAIAILLAFLISFVGLKTACASNVIHIKVGALLENSDHEQANMFIRTIKMINERKDETIRRLLNLTSSGLENDNERSFRIQNELQMGGERQRLQSRSQPQPLPSHLATHLPGPGEQKDERGEGAEVEADQDERGEFGASSSRRRRRGGPEQSQLARVRLEPMVEFLADRHSSLEADCKVCQLIESGVQTIVGPREGLSIQHVQSICDNMEIPYFELRPFVGSPPPATPKALAGLSAAAGAAATQFNSISSPPLPLLSPESRLLADSASLSPAWLQPINSTQGGTGTSQEPAGGRQFGAADASPQANRSNSASVSNSAPNINQFAHSGIQQQNSAHYQAGDSTSTTIEAAEGDSGNIRPDNEAKIDLQIPLQQQQQQSNSQTNDRLEELTLNLHPPAYLLTSAYIDLIYAWNWSSFAIVYEDGNSMIKLQDLFKESSGTWTSKWQIKLFQFNQAQSSSSASPVLPETSAATSNQSQPLGTPSGARQSDQTHGEHANSMSSPATSRPVRSTNKLTFRDIFWRLKLSGELNVLLDVKTEHLYEALKQAQQVGCMTERFSYLITSLDLHTIDLEDFKYSRTRITALSLIQVAKFELPPPQQQTDASDMPDDQSEAGSRAASAFDERYLEKLGVHVIQQSQEESLEGLRQRQKWADSSQRHLGNAQSAAPSASQAAGKPAPARWPKYKLSPSVVLDRSGAFMEPPSDVYKDWSRRESLQSLPASMGLLPSVDRDNEQHLFEFFIEQQERNLTRIRLSTSSAILHDSLLLLAIGLAELDPGARLLAERQTLTCSANSPAWLHGSSLVNYMRRTSFVGLTGPISFDQRGLRADFKLDLLGMAPNIGLVKVGEWHSRHAGKGRRQLSPGAPPDIGLAGEQPASKSVAATTRTTLAQPPGTPTATTTPPTPTNRPYEELAAQYEGELRRYNRLLAEKGRVQVPYGKALSRNGALLVNEIIFSRLYRELTDQQVDTLIVTTKLSQPYFMLKETPNKLEGNDQYEGFAVDLIHELSKLVNFRYRWREVADKKYGSKEVLPNGTVVWNGMIGEIVRGQADLAIVDLTITAQREEAVDFTLPFMNTGISILFKKPTTKVTTLFSFLSPFTSFVWAYVLAAYCGISAVLYFVGHLSPYEWANPHPCGHSNDDQETLLRNQFSLLNSFWFTIGSLMQQGSDLTPRSMSTRTIAGIWYFFTLIMISSYTANLAAFLTVEKVVYPIENVRDLSGQQEIKYGCVESGSTCTFFHDSQIDTYKRINETMSRFRTYVRSNDEGQKRVEEGKFAFFMESASIEYIVERNCNLTQIGGLLDSKGYGLATSKKSRLRRPYRTLLSEGILHLQETGMLHILKNRWWKERRGGGTCTDDGKGGGVTELSLANVGGVFVVLLGGLGISFLVAIAEFMWRARRGGSTRDRMCEEMMSDLKFALACKRSTKPVVARPSKNGPSGGEQAFSADQRRRQFLRRHQRAQQLTGDDSQLDFSSSIARFGYSSDQLELDPNNRLAYQMETGQLERYLRGMAESGQNKGAKMSQLAQEDPALMHSMLSILLHQQQQQELVQQQAAISQKQATNLSRQQQQQRPIMLDNGGGFMLAQPLNGRLFSSTMGSMITTEEQLSGENSRQCYWLSSPTENCSEAGRRRLLFAQK